MDAEQASHSTRSAAHKESIMINEADLTKIQILEPHHEMILSLYDLFLK